MVKKVKEITIEQHFANVASIFSTMYGVCSVAFKDNPTQMQMYGNLIEKGFDSLHNIESKLKEGN